MSVLIVVAHPDDEVLGCGATAAVLSARGVSVRACILSGGAEARRNRPAKKVLHSDTRTASRLLGMKEPILGPFPNIKFNVVPTLDMVQFIEQAIRKTKADVLFTHHPNDLNDDHLHVSRACQVAARLFQRRSDVAPLRELHFMEVPSSTDWSFPGGRSPFQPNTFVEIGERALGRKIEALRAYRGVMREFPHPRSAEILRGLAAYRGGQSGLKYAEAFETAFRVL